MSPRVQQLVPPRLGLQVAELPDEPSQHDVDDVDDALEEVTDPWQEGCQDGRPWRDLSTLRW